MYSYPSILLFLVLLLMMGLRIDTEREHGGQSAVCTIGVCAVVSHLLVWNVSFMSIHKLKISVKLSTLPPY